MILIFSLFEQICSSLFGSHVFGSVSNDGVSIDKLEGISIELFGCVSMVGGSLVSPSVPTWGFSAIAFLDSSIRVVSGKLGSVSRVQLD